ncbi:MULTISPECIES: acetate--CoA ligase [unclassified Citromicrobium]|uniref:acetate--CoA ligase n=1 Tax=unclassified Citromicrobium TaxID=2630544 RepID=UPI0006C90F30|nr:MULTISPECIES: acetate--CoA ligase [unclassified Citromicrobium]OAM10166.1 acetyl-coenzyme A synthetase [Citromicrobium sp. RCC1897]|tara:strand:- start:1515 stop:3791 length:2277 start_codon:yes stop_codon:yes gene_type:complete
MTKSAAPEGRVVRRVIATDAATALLGQIIERHGPVLIHQSGGCCDGSSPMVYPRDEFRIGGSDVLLGTIGTTPVYIGAAQFAAWKHTQLILDVVEGRGGMFSLDNGTGRRFLVRSRTYGEREIAMLHKADRLRAMQASIDSDADAFWLDEAHRLDWSVFPTKADESSFEKADFGIRWFADGELNVSVNCLDRHLDTRGDQPAIVFEGDEPGEGRTLTYRELHGQVCRFANVLKANGIGKGDRVILYMPMVPEAAIAMLACARIGAVHSVVFGGFSPDSLADRIADCGATLVVTADEGTRGGKRIPLKANVDSALERTSGVDTVIVMQRTGGDVAMREGRDIWWEEACADAPADCPPEAMNAEDPLFILYTSGSTGKPKGVLHTTGGYLLWSTLTYDLLFGPEEGKDVADDLFWCTADVGWITGHTYVVYGPLANGARTVMFDGVPNYPDPGRLWETSQRLGVTIFYTAPTAIRALMRQGDRWVIRHDLSSIRLLGTVGEPINHEAWEWYHDIVGRGECPIVDTWWQTETGGALIAPVPGATETKPGSATLPLPGVHPELVDGEGHVLAGATEGNLVLTRSWPGQMRTIFGDHDRFFQTYFSTFPGTYFTGDGARRDEDGYYWITGRVDDVINVSGHRMGTAEVENALDEHVLVAEAAVVGMPHDIKGQGIHAFVTLKAGEEGSDALRQELRDLVRSEIGPFATPDVIQFAPDLPKTRSGKIMRRVLRKIAEGQPDQIGDISTLADPGVVDALRERSPA